MYKEVPWILTSEEEVIIKKTKKKKRAHKKTKTPKGKSFTIFNWKITIVKVK